MKQRKRRRAVCSTCGHGHGFCVGICEWNVAPSPAAAALVEEIEPRILYSADFAPVGLDTPVLTPATEQRTLDSSGEFNSDSTVDARPRRHELVFVDSGTPGQRELVEGLQDSDERDIEVVQLDPARDGVQQITEALAGRSGIDAVHILSHGEPGAVQLGSTTLDFDSLLANAAKIRTWGDALTDQADLLIYGCDVAGSPEGRSLLEAVARLTGADVAASTDPTGAPQLGGDWDLEFELGLVDTPVIVDTATQSQFASLLDLATSDATATEPIVVSAPLAFEVNAGQSDADVDFLARGNGYTVWLTDGDAVIGLQNETGGYAVRLDLRGANDDPAASGENLLESKSNYLMGTEDQWRRDVANYAAVRYDEVYDGIDLRYYGNQRQLEYDFIVKAGADAGAIRFDFEGAQGVSIDANGNLILSLGETGQSIAFQAPVAYQDGPAGREWVTSRYQLLDDGSVGFEVGSYDTSRELVIDPVLAYGTYVGGSGGEQIWNMDADAAGNVYVTGYTASTDLPGAGAYAGGLGDIFVSKLTPTLGLSWSTYIGGSGDDQGYGIAVDAASNVYVAGYTTSTNFPLVSPYQSTLEGGQDAFALKLNASGTGLIYSTLLSSSGNADIGYGVAVDSSNSAYVAGYVSSSIAVDATSTAQTSASSVTVSHTTSGSDRLMLVGISTVDAAGAPAPSSVTYNGTALTLVGSRVNGNNNVRVDIYQLVAPDLGTHDLVVNFASAPDAATVGVQTYTGVNQTTPLGTFASQQGNNNSASATVTSAGDELVFGAVAVDSGTNFDLLPGTGETERWDLFQTGGANGGGGTEPGAAGSVALSWSWSTNSRFAVGGVSIKPKYAGGEAFVTKLTPAGNAVGYSTFLGGTGADFAYNVEVDAAGSAVVVGASASTTFSTPLTGAYQATNGTPGFYDAFVAKLNAAGTGLLYGTFLGGSQDDFGYTVALDAGKIYIGGDTYSSNFDFTAGAMQTVKSGPGSTSDGFVAVIDPGVTGAGSLLYSTFYGGTDNESLWGLDVDAAGRIYAAGYTVSTNLPVTGNAYQSAKAGAAAAEDIFVLALDPALSGAAGRMYASYLGGAGDENAWAATYANGKFYVAGNASTASGITTTGPLFGGVFDGYVAAFSFPVVTTTGTPLAYTENAAATAIDPGLTVTYAGGTNLTGATVRITGNYVNGEDVLAFTNAFGITGTWAPATGTLTLTGTTTLANYQAALQSITYQNTSENPSTAPRTLTFIVNDGSYTSVPATRQITVSAVNDAPVNSVPGAQALNQDTSMVFSTGAGNAISISDIDAGTNPVQITLTATHGVLTLSGFAGLSFGAGDGTADASMTFQGTLSAINTALQGLSYTPDSGYSGSAAITVISNDLGASGGGALTDTDAIAITVLPTGSIAGTLFNDVDGDADIGESGTLRFANATILIYRDTGNGLPGPEDGGPAYSISTNAAGQFSLGGLMNGTYWVAVDSKSLKAPGYNSGFGDTDVWADQTYGAAGAAQSSGFLAAAGALYGGRDAGVSDDAAALASSQHLTRVVLTGGAATGVDSGFSFSAIVNTRGDATDDDGGATARLQQGSLRQFLLNANAISGMQTANFSVGTGAIAIAPSAALPAITDAVVLDATSQEGFSSAPIVELNGSGAGAGASGFTLAAGSDGSTIRGFVVNRFNGQLVDINGSDNNVVAGNYLGTDLTGTADLGSANSGVLLHAGASGNRIGGTVTADSNVISGNDYAGISMHDAGTDNNLVQGNYIGTGAAGSGAIGNGSFGVAIWSGAKGNQIGGTGAGAGNVIANGNSGVIVDANTVAAVENAILGNRIFGNSSLGIDLVPMGVTAMMPATATAGRTTCRTPRCCSSRRRPVATPWSADR